MKKLLIFFVLLATAIYLAGCGSTTEKKDDLSSLSWDEITQRAEGETVNWMMAQGSPFINNYINNYVIPTVKERYNVNLQISAGQGNQIVSTLMTEVEANKGASEVDMAWINGATFYQLREIDALYGPFAEQLPNGQYVDFKNPFINTDFQQPVDGYESPWSITQFVLIYNNANVDDPPRTMEQLETYVKANPDTFTIPNQFTGMTFLKVLLLDIAGDDSLYGEFDEAKYEKYSAELWEYINRIKPYFWKEGETFPSETSTLAQMFATGEINFGMVFGANGLDNMVKSGFLPPSARAYLWGNGSIQNTNFIGIVKHSPNKAGAMVVANFLLSPEAQYRKMSPDVMGSRTVLNIEKLPQKWQKKFEAIPESKYSPPRSKLQTNALQELSPEYMIRISEDFRTKVIQQ
jgi:putative spermidine/putrescine transport system substrate-binding protein